MVGARVAVLTEAVIDIVDVNEYCDGRHVQGWGRVWNWRGGSGVSGRGCECGCVVSRHRGYPSSGGVVIVWTFGASVGTGVVDGVGVRVCSSIGAALGAGISSRIAGGAGGGTIGIIGGADAGIGTEIGARIAGGKSGTAGGVSETGAGGNAGAAAVEDKLQRNKAMFKKR
ncbi:hypothetical protein BDD12DRAFT_806015 [Trichophaea hybrida]|nr:hypothetical protein BDD12DRAFT_806015 [Trichophaea hybrida]